MLATYINENQMSLASVVDPSHSGDWTSEIRIGTMLFCAQGVDGMLLTDAASVVYDAGYDITIITISGITGPLTSNLTAIGYGSSFVDAVNFLSNLTRHGHSAFWDGGYEPFSLWTDDDIVERWHNLGGTSVTVANWLFGVNAAGDDFEKKAVVGTDKQVNVDHAANAITFSLPQDIDETSSPTFAGLGLSGLLSKVLITDSSGNLTSPTDNSTGRATLIKTGSAYTLEDFKFAGLSDVVWPTAPATPNHGDIVKYSSVSGKLELMADTTSSGTDTSTVLALIQAFMPESESGGAADSHAGTHIDGGADEIDADKLIIDYSPLNYTPVVDSGITDATDQLTSHLKGIAEMLAVPSVRDYCPTPFSKVSDSAIQVNGGTYYAMGYRHKGAYEKRTATKFDFGGMASAAVASHMIDSGLVNSSWYDVYITGATTIVILPWVHVHSVALDTTNTRIYIGQHLDETIYETGFFSTSNPFNNYRLIKQSFDTSDKTIVYVNGGVSGGSYDYLVVGGNYTSVLAAGDWLHMAPPSSTDSVYIGSLYIDDSGSVKDIIRTGWTYRQPAVWGVDGQLSPDTYANTNLSAIVSPAALRADLQVDMYSYDTDTTMLWARLLSGGSGENIIAIPIFNPGSPGAMQSTVFLTWEFSLPAAIRNRFSQQVPPDTLAMEEGYLQITSFSE